MKKSSFTCNYQTYIISNDGSIIFINLPHKKKPVQLLIDLSNNSLFTSPISFAEIETKEAKPLEVELLVSELLVYEPLVSGSPEHKN